MGRFILNFLLKNHDNVVTDNTTGDALDKIFTKAIQGQSMYKDKKALRSDYIPEKLPFREKQITIIGEILAPILNKSKCSNLFIYGKPGTGKTAVARYVLKRLIEKASSLKEELNVRFAYSNARVAGTEYRLLSEIAKDLTISIPFTGLALSEVFKRIIEKISNTELSAVFIIDEIDFIVKNFGDDLLYEFTRANEQISKGFLTIIGISNDLQFKEYLEPRVLSSLSEEEIIFSPYTAEELQSILKERVSTAFIENAITSGAINLCAALAGSEHGDARRAIDLLRVSSEVADREGAKQVDEKHVRIAIQKIEQDRVVDAVRSLPLHAKILLTSILTIGNPESTGEVYQTYSNICKKIGIEILTQRRIGMLLGELDLLGLIATNVISKGRYGRTKRISPSVPIQFIREILSEDSIIKNLL